MSQRTAFRSAFAFLAALVLSAAAHAQPFRAYLSTTGLDTNPCSLPAPCRLLPAALATVASGGEIWILDSANYNTGPVNIAKSVTILAVPGVVGSVVSAGGNAIDINTAGVNVVLRNLVIVPQVTGAAGANGINMTNGASLTIEDCLIANLPLSGILVGNGATLRMTDTTIRGNGGHGLVIREGAHAIITRAMVSGNTNTGIFAYGDSVATVTADIADSTVDGNAQGIHASTFSVGAVVKVSVRGSRLVRNSFEGLSGSGTSTTISASNNFISRNTTGIELQSVGGTIWASGNTVTHNSGSGFSNNALVGGVFESAHNNSVHNNGQDTTGTITTVALK